MCVLLKNLSSCTFIFFIFLTSSSVTSRAATGIYAGLAMSVAKQTGLPSNSEAQAKNSSANTFPGGRIGIGYLHDFNTKLGIGFEVGRGYYGSTDYSLHNNREINIKTSAIEFLLVAAYHVRKMDIIGKVGGNRNSTTIKLVGINDAQSRIQLTVMLETAYQLNPRLAITASYLHTTGNKINNFDAIEWKAPGINAGLLGLRVNFW